MELRLNSNRVRTRLNGNLVKVIFTEQAAQDDQSLTDFISAVNSLLPSESVVYDAAGQTFSYDQVADSALSRIKIRGDSGGGSNITTTSSGSITIRNANFRGGRPQDWSLVGDGIYKVSATNVQTLLNTKVNGGDVTAGKQNDGRITFFDRDATSTPVPAIYPAASTDLDTLRYTNGDQWVSAYSGSANAPDFTCNISSGLISGFVVTGDTKASLDSLNASCALSTMHILVYTNSTIYCTKMAYDSSSGTLTLTDSMPVTTYVDFCFIGGARNTTSLLSAGEFSLDASNGDIYYRPANGDPSSAGWGEIGRLFELVNIDTERLIFEDCTFADCNGPQLTLQASTDESSALVSLTTTSSSQANCPYGATFIRCEFERSPMMLNTAKWDVTSSTIGETIWMGSIALEGSSFDSSIFRSAQGAECVRFVRTVTGFETTAMSPVVVDNCWFTNVAAHGQCISLYQGTALNAAVTNSVFYNSYRSVAIKMPVSANCTVGDELIIANNICYIDSLPLPLPSEGAIQISSGSDNDLSADHRVRVQNNTCISKADMGNDRGKYSRIGFIIHGWDGNGYLQNWKTGLNICSHLEGVAGTGTNWGDGSGHVYNLYWEDRDFVSPEVSVYTYGASATPQDVNQRSAIDFDNLSLNTDGTASNIPSEMGVQWATVPMATQTADPDYCIGLAKPSALPANLIDLDSYDRSAAVQARRWSNRVIETASGSGASWTVADGTIVIGNNGGKVRATLTLGSSDESYVTTNDPVIRIHYGSKESALAQVTQTDSTTIVFDSLFNYIGDTITSVYMMNRDNLL